MSDDCIPLISTQFLHQFYMDILETKNSTHKEFKKLCFNHKAMIELKFKQMLLCEF